MNKKKEIVSTSLIKISLILLDVLYSFCIWAFNYNQIIKEVLVNNKIERILITHIADFTNNLSAFHVSVQINHKMTTLSDISKILNKNISKYLHKIIISENYNDFILWSEVNKYLDYNRSI